MFMTVPALGSDDSVAGASAVISPAAWNWCRRFRRTYGATQTIQSTTATTRITELLRGKSTIKTV
jgi:hypothetical protein